MYVQNALGETTLLRYAKKIVPVAASATAAPPFTVPLAALAVCGPVLGPTASSDCC